MTHLRLPINRDGRSLIEMLVVIVLLSTLLGLASGILLRLGHMESHSRASRDLGQATLRLMRDLRRDAKSATAVQILEAEPVGNGLQFAVAGQEVSYRPVAKGIQRTVANTNRREFYRLGDVVCGAAIDGPICTLNIAPKLQSPGRLGVAAGPLVIVASVMPVPISEAAAKSPLEAPRPASKEEL